ncbi:hypothetical protein ACRBEV_03970 [Methylobacterium phyllosphaerae]
MSAVAAAAAGATTSGALLFTYGGIVVGPARFGAPTHATGDPAISGRLPQGDKVVRASSIPAAFEGVCGGRRRRR